jgi:hypothetical protein
MSLRPVLREGLEGGPFHFMLDPDLRVDIVYLWVNGSDPVWRRKLQRAATPG